MKISLRPARSAVTVLVFLCAAGALVEPSAAPVADPAALLASSAVPPDPASLLPDGIDGYAPGEEDGIYTHDTLFQLIDGSAEVYRAFNVRLTVSRLYVKPDVPDIIADVFDMGSSRDAFGAYHHDLREGEDAGIGHESEYAGGALYFWKDRFFVSILAFDETAGTERAVRALGRAIAGKIPRHGAKPEILRLLPRNGPRAAQVTYFHDWTYLNTRRFIADENLLGLDRETEGILARYRSEDRAAERQRRDSFVLLLARYPSARLAGKALESFLAGYLSGASPQGALRRDDGTWAAAWRIDDVVVAVLDAVDEGAIGRLAAEVGEAADRQGGGGSRQGGAGDRQEDGR